MLEDYKEELAYYLRDKIRDFHKTYNYPPDKQDILEWIEKFIKLQEETHDRFRKPKTST